MLFVLSTHKKLELFIGGHENAKKGSEDNVFQMVKLIIEILIGIIERTKTSCWASKMDYG